jgi:hypothetical protein
MLSFLVIICPLVVAAVAVLMAAAMPVKREDETQLKRLMINIAALGLFCTVFNWWYEATRTRQLTHLRSVTASSATTTTPAQYQEKIRSLKEEIADLQSRLATENKNGLRAEAKTTAAKQQSAVIPKLYWTQESAGGASALRFKVYGTLNIPGFLAICDRPCRATNGQIGPDSSGTQVVGTTPKMAGYIFSKPRPVPAGADGYLIIEPSAARVTEFRVLSDSEIPDGLR